MGRTSLNTLELILRVFIWLTMSQNQKWNQSIFYVI